MACDRSCCPYYACGADSCPCCTCTLCRPDCDTWMTAAADFEPEETTVVVDPE